MYSREIVILANSRKHGGRCIAGIDMETNEWIRPINDVVVRPDPTVFMPNDFGSYFGETFGPLLRDIVKIGFTKKNPLRHQPENELIDRKKWFKAGRLSIPSLKRLKDTNECDWIFDCEYPTDRIPADKIQNNPISTSLTLLHLNRADHEPMIRHTTTQAGHLQTRLAFDYEDHRFDLSLTDVTYPILKKNYTDEQLVHDFCATIGLGELYPTTDAYHKLVVGFIPVIGGR